MGVGKLLMNALMVGGSAAMLPMGYEALNTRGKRQRATLAQLMQNQGQGRQEMAIRMETAKQNEYVRMLDAMDAFRQGGYRETGPFGAEALGDEAVKHQLGQLIDDQARVQIAETAYSGATDPIQMMARLGMH
jgi:hypothetical protein